MAIVQPAQLLETPEVSPLALLHILLSKYDRAFLVEEFDDVLDWLEDDFGAVHDLVAAKIRALRVCNATAAPWERFEVFAPVVQAFNGIPVKFNAHLPMEPHELALGIYVMEKLRTEDFEEEPSKYVAASLQADGLFFIPIPELSIARKYIRPYNAGAESVFLTIRDKDPDEVEVNEDSPEGVQAAKGKAELIVYQETLDLWTEHQESAMRVKS